ncbi:MAG: AAA family ATPase [Tepidanaerobacteraceae bacterium]|nr:AAA family ATPase [Tepidanaerobacteraceae bacterium]
MGEGNVIRYFPGNNTPDGYYSFFNHILPWKKARRIIIIKGGPGVGKSTMIRKITKELTQRGLDIELLHCTADSNSLDGLIVKDYNIAVVDGTAPHIIDPKFPGCVDEIINFGEFWDETGLQKNKEQIFVLQEKVSQLYKRVYKYLKTSRLIFDDLEDIYSGVVDFRLAETKTDDILYTVFKDVERNNKISFQRHMFASGITPEGPINFLDSLFNDINRRFIISGYPGTGKSTLLQRVMDQAISKGLNVDVFHCSMNPEKIEHIIIKEINVGFITSIKPHLLSNIRKDDETIDMNSVLNISKLNNLETFIEYNNSISWELFNMAIKTLQNVKKTRNELETIYASKMNFGVTDKVREQILSKIIKYIY